MAEIATPANITSTVVVNAGTRNRRSIAEEFVAMQKADEKISKKPTIHKIAISHIKVDLEIYETRADGQPLTQVFAEVPPPAQRYFIF